VCASTWPCSSYPAFRYKDQLYRLHQRFMNDALAITMKFKDHDHNVMVCTCHRLCSSSLMLLTRRGHEFTIFAGAGQNAAGAAQCCRQRQVAPPPPPPPPTSSYSFFSASLLPTLISFRNKKMSPDQAQHRIQELRQSMLEL
jgi:hypothetical protein